MSNQGWIKLYRSIQSCWIWEATPDEPFNKATAWVDILLSCNHADKKIMFDGQPYVVKRGEWVTSILKLGERWCWGRKKVSNFLNLLESDGMIEQQRNNKRTLIKVLNYEVYQDFDTPQGTTEEQPRNNRGTTEEQQRNTNNNDKNDKNEKNINIRHKYGQYQNVLLTDEDYQKLVSEFPSDYQERIERLSEYIASTGKSYKSHLATIRSWARKDKDKPKKANQFQQFPQNQYDYDALEAQLVNK